MERIENFKMDLEELREGLIEFQENQLKVLKELEKINDLEELDAEIENSKCDFEVESENLIKEFMYISNKSFNEAIDDIWDKAKGGVEANV